MLQLSDFAIPSSSDVQCQIIADLISSPESIPEAEKLVKKEMFEGDCLKAWETMIKMFHEGVTIDIITVGETLGTEFLSQKILPMMANISGSGSYINDHCVTLTAAHARKTAYQVAIDLLQASQEGSSQQDLLAIVDTMSARLMESGSDAEEDCITDAINRYFDALQDGSLQRISCGLQTLDCATKGGFAPGQLVILAARPSVGKTALMLQMALTMSRAGVPARVYSLEMSEAELVERILLSTGKVCSYDIFGKNWQNMESAAGAAPECFYIKTGISDINRIIADITLSHRVHKCGAAFIDYLGLIDPIDPKALPAYDIGVKTKRLKKLAETIGIPIILLCQLNRSSVSENRPPELHDLRDSGDIEQDADIVLMLESSTKTDINLWVRKNRHGKKHFKIMLGVNDSYTSFREEGVEGI